MASNDLYSKAIEFKQLLTSIATGAARDNGRFVDLRKQLIQNADAKRKFPSWLVSCRSADDFWSFIQPKFSSYAERRAFLSADLEPLLYYLEETNAGPGPHSADHKSISETTMQLFLSHSSRDEELAESLINLLRAGIDGLSPKKIRCTSVNGYRLNVGAHTDEQLRNEVLTARSFVGLITSASIDSAYVLFELGARWGAGLPLAPLLGAGATSKSLRGPLGGLNALKCEDAGQLHQFVTDIAGQLGLEVNAPAVYQKTLDQTITVSKRLASTRSESESSVRAQQAHEGHTRRQPRGIVNVVVEDLFLRESDLLVIPCSAQGTISSSIEGHLDEWDIQYPSPMPLGEVRLIEAGRLPAGVNALAYAASVSGNASSIDAIETIGLKLGQLTRENRRLRQIAVPLLGSGAGKLPADGSFKALVRGFSEAAAEGSQLTVCILDRKIAEFVKQAI